MLHRDLSHCAPDLPHASGPSHAVAFPQCLHPSHLIQAAVGGVAPVLEAGRKLSADAAGSALLSTDTHTGGREVAVAPRKSTEEEDATSMPINPLDPSQVCVSCLVVLVRGR